MKELQEVFEFRTYKSFLHSRAGPRGSRHGVKQAMAKVLRCQPTYVSQVLNGSAHFSLEQGELLADFFGFTPEQKHFFLLLLQRDRAGTKRLEAYFSLQLEELLARRLVLTQRLGAKNSLTSEDQSIYYSSWHFAAVHVALTIPELRTPKALAQELGLSLKRVAEVCDFLCRTGLAVREGSELHVGEVQIRLGNQSHNILKHHTNWRNKAVESLDRESLRDLHYSAVASLSRDDVVKLKDKMLDFIHETVQAFRASKEEELYTFTMDFFDLKKEAL